MGIKPTDLDYVLLTHLDCDHANGLRAMKDAKHIIVAQEELDCARKNGSFAIRRSGGKVLTCRPSSGTVQKVLPRSPSTSLAMAASR